MDSKIVTELVAGSLWCWESVKYTAPLLKMSRSIVYIVKSWKQFFCTLIIMKSESLPSDFEHFYTNRFTMIGNFLFWFKAGWY